MTSFFIFLFIALLILRSSGIIEWSWWIIWLPLFIFGISVIKKRMFAVSGRGWHGKKCPSWLRQYEKEQRTLDKQVERNLKGIELEKKGHTDKAIELYEQNISENSDGNHPYDRLAIIYRKRNQIDDEIRVLEKAVGVFKNIVSRKREDRLPKLNNFRKRLQKAQKTKLSS